MSKRKLWAAVKYLPAFPFKLRCATESCCWNSCPRRSQLTQRLWRVSSLARQEAQAPDRCSQSLSGSGLQDVSHVHIIHQLILKVKERVRWGWSCRLWTAAAAGVSLYLSSPEEPRDQDDNGTESCRKLPFRHGFFYTALESRIFTAIISQTWEWFQHGSH